ncbi:MAG: S41 family peptidase [Vulcanimicrobiota bacterium]
MGLTGYYQRPTICGDKLIFIFEDDLWLRDLSSRSTDALRLTANPGRSSDPHLSPDGQWLAYTSMDEGQPEIYVTRLDEMEPRRLTYLGDDTRCVGWSRNGNSVLFTTSAGCPFRRIFQLGEVPAEGGPPEPLNLGPAAHISYSPVKGRVIGRHTWDPARWKRYRGGTAGQIWIDRAENGSFTTLLKLHGNLTRPLWVGDRIYFGSDHEGMCNLYSCLPDGSELTRHTHHQNFYLRYPASDGKRIVYQCGGDLYLYDPRKENAEKLEVTVHTQRRRLARHFVNTPRYLQGYNLSPDGSRTAIVSRGKAFCFSHWEGAVTQLGEHDGVRYRRLRWSPHGIFCVNDQSGEEEIGLFLVQDPKDTPGEYLALTSGQDIGRVLNMGLAPCGKRLWFSNHRHELYALEVDDHFLKWHKRKLFKGGKAKNSSEPPLPALVKIAHDDYDRINDAAWSPDSLWLAFSRKVNRQDSRIMLWSWASRESTPVTSVPFHDWSPDFDPEGRYLYFLSCRDFDPVKDNLFFEYSFPRASRPHLVTLQKEQPDPFLGRERAPGADPPEPPSPYLDADDEKEDKKKKKDDKNKAPRPIRVDLEGIEERIRVFPVDEGRYFGVLAVKGKVILGKSPVRSVLATARTPKNGPEAILETYDFKSQELAKPFTAISGFDLSLDRSTLIYRSDNALRVVRTDKMNAGNGRGQNRASGWLDLNRIKVSVKPQLEWQQMLREAWRLMRDHFWDPKMASIDWNEVLKRYSPLLDRIATRREFSDLLWEFQGELGTSHAYEYGGDYRPGPYYAQGKLAATLKWDGRARGYRILEIAEGDPRSETETSPLRVLHHPLEPGDVLTAVNGHPVSPTEPCEKFLVNQAEQRVTLTVVRRSSHRGKGKPKPEDVVVLALKRETPVRYREWVERNKRKVHELSDGKVGYLHIPNMGPDGFAEFHRSFYSEVERDGLIVDVRYNGGGNVSGLLLEKLQRRRIGFDVQRWGAPIPYPQESLAGPLVAITNEQAGSDGDIFSHCFKLLGLGPLLGKRTWGGTIGIWPRHSLVDGTVTTQPEFAFWFPDVGWGVENYGTDPDEEIEIRPQDWRAGKDPQLARAVEVALEQIEKTDCIRVDQITERGNSNSRCRL